VHDLAEVDDVSLLDLLRTAKAVTKDYVHSRHWPRRPESINVEITAACDARCIHCPRLDMDRPMKPMAMGLFQKLIEEAVALGVPYICPNGFGEICTIPVPELAKYFDCLAATKGGPKWVINTNGNRMNEERCALFIKHAVKLVNITIDGATAATAEAIRVKLNFDRIETNIKNLLAMRNIAGRRYPKVRVGMIAMPQTIPEIDPFVKRWTGVADFVGLGGFSSRLSSVVESPSPARQELVQIDPAPAKAAHRPKVAACVLPFRDLNIWADGKAVLCCEDWNEEHIVGDVTVQSLKEIWMGPQLTEVRRRHLAKLGHNIDICAKCNNWIGPSIGTRLWV
jgi:MoaA/NifB/PqqE/SkfB family radical SAM enzyme